MTSRYTGPELRRVRRLVDLRQADVAAAIGVNRSRIAHIESQVRVTPTAATRYLHALDTLTRDSGDE